ncbi:DMT family transporter [Saxibacter everestensis]|uniref:DMT family transporter n=1 Tax=Saxibacter everestensis TaxID=2909229 RepID=A0ABY8QNS6_9MICO|nr:DMT family transporter [Brevibacteriaceae bacterium ZFBP1038]
MEGTTKLPIRTPMLVAAYLALALIWGSSFLFIKVAVGGMSPAQVVLGRLLLGAITLCALMMITRRKWPREPKLWGHLSIVALFACVVPFLLFSWASQFLPSGVSSILNATTPITTLAVSALMLPAERLNRIQILGVFVGAIGVVVVVGPWDVLGDPLFASSLPAQLACLVATTCYGIAFSYLRRFVVGANGHDAVTVSAVQISIAAAMMLLIAPFAATTPLALNLPIVLSMIGLGAVGTGIAYIWFTVIVGSWGSTAASSVTYLTPLVGVILGILVLAETLHWNQPVGGIAIVLGILVSQSKGTAKRKRPRHPVNQVTGPQRTAEGSDDQSRVSRR